MKPDEVASELQRELHFDPRTANAYVRALGRCEYCDRDLVFDRLGYACGQIDHLLPRWIYPYEIAGHPQNFVLSCSLCNGIKREADVLRRPNEDAVEMLVNHREELVLRARALIQDRLEEPNRRWQIAKTLLRHISAGRACGDAQPTIQVDSPAFGGPAA